VDAGLVMESTGEIDDAGAVPRPLAAEDDGGGGGTEAAPCHVGAGAYGRFDPTSTDLQRPRP